MLGNVWDYRMISLAKQLWRECQIKVPGLGPIHWVCHESGVRRVASQGAKLGPEIEWQGEVAEDRLHDTLLKSDLAFVPFSANADSNYARFSIPSKLGELAAVGMPMVILAGSHTASAKYVTDYGVAELLTELTQNHWPKRLCEIIQSADERARLSTSARKYADRYLNQESFRTEIFDDLRAAAFGDARRNDGEREGTRSAAFGEIRS